MKTYFVRLSAGVSLVCCLAWIFLSVASYFNPLRSRDIVVPHTNPHPVFVGVDRGTLQIMGYFPFPLSHVVRLRMLGFRINTHFSYYSTAPWYIGIPLYALVLASLLFPACVVLARCRTARASGLHCESCGYDLRATPERCPECGTLPAKAAV
jgi:hypothetical protein